MESFHSQQLSFSKHCRSILVQIVLNLFFWMIWRKTCFTEYMYNYNRGRVIKQTDFSFIVSLDEKLPCPEDIFVEIHQSQSEAEVTLPDLVTYDDVEVTPEWARSKEGFPVGSTTVTIQTRPGSLYNDSCSFSVHVLGKWRSPAELMVYRIVALF